MYTTLSDSPPIVLVFAGHDPTGGAGLTADTQALAQCGCHIAPIVTCVTAQNTHNVKALYPLPKAQIMAQAQYILEDMPIKVVKLGLLGSIEAVEAIAEILISWPDLPVIFDPVLAAGGGENLSSKQLISKIKKELFPLTTLLTPNRKEAENLTGEKNLEMIAKQLTDSGCEYVCVTDVKPMNRKVINILYTAPQQEIGGWHWSRLPYQYHGSGCTFAANLAGFIACGYPIIEAVYQAQRYTWFSLRQGFIAGQGQRLPNRITHCSSVKRVDAFIERDEN